MATPSVAAPALVRAADRRGTSVTSWGPAGVEAARRHEEALELLLRIASRELHLARLGEEIQGTSRRINALEQLLLPALAAEAARIASALEERDREDAVRLKRLRARRAARSEPSGPHASSRSNAFSSQRSPGSPQRKR